MFNNKYFNDYNSMDDEEKTAIRYGAEGRDLSDVIRSSHKKISDPNKVFDAWVKGEGMRKTGESKAFLDEIEKSEMDELEKSLSKRDKTDANGISASPIKDIWGNDLANDTYEKAENTEDNASIEKMPFITDFDSTAKAQALPHINNLLPKDKDYDIMYLSDDADSAGTTSSGQTNQNASESESSTTFVTYGYSDENVVGGIQLRLNELGYTDVDITGTFDASTEAAIKEFQEERELPVTGVLDDATKAEMGFSDDYSVSRKGENATPWHAPYSPPFNMEDYKREQERLKREKEEALKAKEDEENLPFYKKLILPILLRETYEGTAPTASDLTEENKLPENSNEGVLQDGNVIDGANYPYPVDGYN